MRSNPNPLLHRSHNKNRLFHTKKLTLNKLAGGFVSLSVLTFMLLSAISSLPLAYAGDIDVDVQDDPDPYISLSIIDSASCPNSNHLVLDIAPNSLLNGTITSDCATIAVDTSSVYGYALTMNGDSDQKLHRTAGDPYELDPVASATPTTPQKLSTDTWGWGIAGFSNLNTTYIKENSNSLSVSTSKWAAAPATPTLIKQPNATGVWTNSDKFDIYFAAAADKATPTGTYSGTVTFTVSSEGLQLDKGSTDIVVDTDPAMIPIAYIGSTTTPQWVVADTTNSHTPNTYNANGGTYDWYDYNKKIWANAVTVTSTSRAAYQSAPAGTPILDADVVGYWVYIPRYRYQTWTTTWNSTNYPRSINIAFEDCHSNGTTCQTSGYAKSTVSDVLSGGVGTWATHPAFTFNGHELNGLWIGKYENTGSTGSPTILPNVTPLTNITINQMFVNAKALSGTDSTTIAGGHGLTTTYSNTRITNSTIWGAIAYLSQSLYGVCTNVACTTDGAAATSLNPTTAQKIWNNGTAQCAAPYNSGRTGYGNTGKTDTCLTTIGYENSSYTTDNAYYGVNGQLASSTNNPTGIYDLAGGAWEYNLDVYNSTILTASSGITAFDAKYMNNYPNPPLTNSDNDLYSGKYNLTDTFTTAFGQALYETGGGTTTTSAWNSDYSSSVYATYPWSVRGGHSGDGADAGVFASGRNTGGVTVVISSRAVQSTP